MSDQDQKTRDFIEAELHRDHECAEMATCPMYTETSSGVSMRFTDGSGTENICTPQPCLYQQPYQRSILSVGEQGNLEKCCVHFGKD